MPKSLFLELETSNFGYSHVFSSRFVVQNVKLGKIWPRRFNGLKKTKLEPKFEVSISKNKDLVTQCNLQKVWKILLLKEIYFFLCNVYPVALDRTKITVVMLGYITFDSNGPKSYKWKRYSANTLVKKSSCW